jgi:hypothetical protein
VRRVSLVTTVRREWAEEAGVNLSREAAWAVVDRMCYAFAERWECGEDRQTLVARELDTAQHLTRHWRGEPGRQLRLLVAEATK